jgi:hypothetical protein
MRHFIEECFIFSSSNQEWFRVCQLGSPIHEWISKKKNGIYEEEVKLFSWERQHP